jgi:hypothetical protein
MKTKKPMMAKRTTKAAPAKKKMMASAKKPMTVKGKKVQKYQVGGMAAPTRITANTPAQRSVATPGGPSATMPPSNPRVVRPRPPQTGGVNPRPAAPGVGYGGIGRPGAQGRPGQGMISNNSGGMMGQSPEYAQMNQLLSTMDPRSPFYNAVQQRVQQMGGLQSNNGGGMMSPPNQRPRPVPMNQPVITPPPRQGMPQGMPQGMMPPSRINIPGITPPMNRPVRTPPQPQGMPQGMNPAMQLYAEQQGQMPPMVQGMQGMDPRMHPDYQSPETIDLRDPAMAARYGHLGRGPQPLTQEQRQQLQQFGTPLPRFRKGGEAKKKAAAQGRMAKPARRKK